ncbi:MAG: hypothetical protein AB7F43_05520 [Bacteriovoracia bacterium]
MERLPFLYQEREFWEFYCPICKIQRRSFYWPTPRKKHYVAIVVAGLFLWLVSWPWAGWKGVFLILPFWAFFEFFYRARARQSLICSQCGFDPYLYKFDVKLARKKVEEFFAEKAARKKKVKEAD